MGRTEFTASPAQLRIMYETGYGIADIMARTGKEYGDVMERLRSANVELVTGGPHDIRSCRDRHDHDVHARGTDCCRVARKRHRRAA